MVVDTESVCSHRNHLNILVWRELTLAHAFQTNTAVTSIIVIYVKKECSTCNYFVRCYAFHSVFTYYS